MASRPKLVAPTKLQLREKLRGFVSELLEVTDPKRMRELNLSIQRHVVALQLASITEGDDEFDAGELQKQMALLNRMLEGEVMGLPGAGDIPASDELTKASEILQARGIDDRQAGRLVHVLSALMSRTGDSTLLEDTVPDGPR